MRSCEGWRRVNFLPGNEVNWPRMVWRTDFKEGRANRASPFSFFSFLSRFSLLSFLGYRGRSYLSLAPFYCHNLFAVSLFQVELARELGDVQNDYHLARGMANQTESEQAYNNFNSIACWRQAIAPDNVFH